MKNQEPKYPVYRVTVFGKDVEFTPNLRDAEDAFKDSRNAVMLWSVDANGNATLLKKKL